MQDVGGRICALPFCRSKQNIKKSEINGQIKVVCNYA